MINPNRTKQNLHFHRCHLFLLVFSVRVCGQALINLEKNSLHPLDSWRALSGERNLLRCVVVLTQTIIMAMLLFSSLLLLLPFIERNIKNLKQIKAEIDKSFLLLNEIIMGSTDKSDMDRIGLFKEMEYVTIKDPYKSPASCEFH